MKEYLVYFKTGLEEGFERLIFSKSLLGAKQRATRVLRKSDSKITAIEIKHGNIYVAHRFAESKKWSSFV
ncbi:hypothetical protein [Leptospira noguchii]|uniref:hypothetical protein n=1 Tax=Leptospira noguchii TaxID=28182 RepID=UPI00114723B2|nr:hypothetical protein [Leptospira noguchii]TQE71268.1 hypothetical protein FF021_14290 [Leptospira noguchii]UOG51116.1 hypothetical protein MAL09_10220 [Leptospira noguchii]